MIARFKLILSLNPISLTFVSIVLVLALFLVGVPILDLIELKTYDLRFVSRGHEDPSSAIVLAVIDEKSMDTEGRWPWSRSKIAALVDILSRERAKVIGFDVGFFEPDENSSRKLIHQLQQDIEALDIRDKKLSVLMAASKINGDNDLALANAIERSSAEVILGYFFHVGQTDTTHRIEQEEIKQQLKRIAPSKYPLIIYEDEDMEIHPFIKAHAPESNLEILTRAARFSGYFNIMLDQDGVARWIPLIIECGENTFPALSLMCAWNFLDRPQLMVRVAAYGVEGVHMGERFIPTDENGQMLINYLGPAKSYPYFSISSILHGKFPKGAFEDKIVLVGMTAAGLSDIRTTPFDPLCPGIEIHATVIDNILSKRFLSRPRWAGVYDLLAIIVLGLLTGMVLPRLNALIGLLFVSALFILHIIAARWLFVHSGIWLSIVYPLMVVVITYISLTAYSYFSEARERKKIKGAFSRYVSPSVISEMLKHPEQLKLGGEEREASVLFCDLAGFTSVSENVTPHELITLLSDYFAEMTEALFAHEGMLKEYVGDEMMGIFGAPLEQPDHAERACSVALAMQDRQQALRQAWVKMGRPPLSARTGINSGPMLVGNVGSVYRFSYGVLGDHVNLASRLEGLNKRYGTEIMIGENTARMVNGLFLLRELDIVRVKGKEQPVRVYELIGKSGVSLPKKKEESLICYASGLEAYRQQRWKEAMGHFGQAREFWPDDAPSLAMTERCLIYQKMPYQDDWDGVFIDRRK